MRGEGSVSQRCDEKRGCPPKVNGVRPKHRCKGLWVAQLELGHGPDGKRRRKAVYGATQAEAVRKLALARREYEQHGRLPTRNWTVEGWLRHWISNVAQVRASTRDSSYRPKIERACTVLGRHRLDRLTPEHLRGLYRAMAGEGLSRSTIVQTHRILHHALGDAVRESVLLSNPAGKQRMDTPTVGSRPSRVVPMTGPQVLALLQTIRGDRLESRWLYALTLGSRQGEVLGLGWEDIDWRRQVAHISRSLTRVRGEGLTFTPVKSATSERMVPLPPFLLASLERRREVFEAEREAPGFRYQRSDYGPLAPEGLVWGWPNGRPRDGRRDWGDWSDLLSRAGVPHVGTHVARHTVATMLAARGAPPKVVQALLGHSQVSLTLGVYTSADVEAMRPWLASLEEGMRELGSPSG